MPERFDFRYDDEAKKTLLLAREEETGASAAKPIITLSDLKIIIMLGMLAIILCDIRSAAEITVPFILALFVAVILNPLVQHMVHWRIPCVLAVSILITIIVIAMVLLLAYLGSALNELTRALPQYRNSIVVPLQVLELLLQRVRIDISIDQLAHYVDPNAAITLLTSLLTQLSNTMSSIFLLLLTVLFMLLGVSQLPGKFQQMMARPVERMAAIQRAIGSVSRYPVLKTAISIITGLVAQTVLATLDVRFVSAWGSPTFALNYIPNIDSVLATIPPIAQVLVFNGFYEALLVLAEYLLVNLVFSNILKLRIMGRGLGLSALVVFLSLIFWGWLLGPMDTLLSVPLMIIIRIAFEQTAGGQNIAVLLSDLNKE